MMTKKFKLHAIGLAVAALGATSVQAGDFLTGSGGWADGAAATVNTYAREALASDGTTVASLPALDVEFNDFEVTGGVPYRVVLTLTGAEWSGAQPATPNAMFANDGDTVVSCVPVTFDNQTDAQWAWECTADADDSIGLGFNAGILDVTNHTLHSGGSVSLGAKLQSREGFANYDTVATTKLMASGFAVVVTADNDTATRADVNHANGALYGFVAANDDTAGTAKATFVVDNNNAGLLCPNGADGFDMAVNCGAYNIENALTFTLSDTRSFQALAAGGLTAEGGDDIGTFADGVPAADGVYTLTVTPTADMFPPGAETEVVVDYDATQLASLGASRTIGLGWSLDGGGQENADDNTDWWQWGNNGSILRVPFLTGGNSTTQYSNVHLVNTTADEVSFTTTCYTSEGGEVDGMASTIPAAGTRSITPNSLCGTTARTGAVITVAAPQGDVFGSVFRTNKTTGDTGMDALLENLAE